MMFDASWAAAAERVEQGCVARIKPRAPHVFPDDLFQRQYRVMQLMYRRGVVRVARALWFEADASLLGAPFFVLGAAEGAACRWPCLLCRD